MSYDYSDIECQSRFKSISYPMHGTTKWKVMNLISYLGVTVFF